MNNIKAKDITIIGLSIAVLIVCSYLSIPIGPVAISIQTLGVFLIAYLFGAKIGFLTTLSYLIIGLIGVPVFAGGTSGLSKIFSPSFGFLLAFLPVSYFIGKNNHRKRAEMLGIYLIANIFIYIIGAAYFYIFMNIYNGVATNISKTLSLTVFPFIFGDFLKIVLVEIISRPIKKALAKNFY